MKVLSVESGMLVKVSYIPGSFSVVDGIKKNKSDFSNGFMRFENIGCGHGTIIIKSELYVYARTDNGVVREISIATVIRKGLGRQKITQKLIKVIENTMPATTVSIEQIENDYSTVFFKLTDSDMNSWIQMIKKAL